MTNNKQRLYYIYTQTKDIYNWKTICEVSKINYQVFRNEIKNEFNTCSEQWCRQLINGIAKENQRINQLIIKSQIDMSNNADKLYNEQYNKKELFK